MTPSGAAVVTSPVGGLPTQTVPAGPADAAAGASTAAAGAAAPAAVRETHSAVVVLLGDRAYKVKKPVNLGFLDFRTRESREAACHREVELNRRLAPDVYLGVSDVVDETGQACEHVVVMRRMPDDRRLSALVQSGADIAQHVAHLARMLATFHAGTRTGPDVCASGTAGALRARWMSNTTALRELRPRGLPPTLVDEIERLALRFVDGRRALLEARIAAGYVRDGHGDLLADDIFLLPDGPRVLDCLDFDDGLRWMDVLDDVACLAADLERLGASDAALALLDDYHRFSGVPQPQNLRHHYVAYRAVMRAKVAAIRAAATSGPEAVRARAECESLCRLGLRHLSRGRVRLILVGGAPATGKSTVASRLADTTSTALLSSDRVRKELHGLAATQPAPAGYEQGIYTSAASRRTYAELAARARLLLQHGESVVLDASFTRVEHRNLLRRVAADTDSDMVELRCSAPSAVVQQRLRRREHHPAETSDATLATGLLLAAVADPWPEAVVVDTSGPPAAAVDLALHDVGER